LFTSKNLDIGINQKLLVFNLAKVEKTMLDKYQGCLLGVAIGDALGFAVEFVNSRQQIENTYPSVYKEFIRGQDNSFPGQYSDDTEMSLYVTRGLLNSSDNTTTTLLEHQAQMYGEWYRKHDNSRAPGNTCLAATRKLADGVHWSKSGNNGSKGCGTAMRSAPFGLFFYESQQKEQLIEITGKASLMTHGLPEATAGAVGNALCVHYALPAKPAEQWIDKLLEDLGHLSPTFNKKIQDIEVALEMDPFEGVDFLGEGWIAEEALAIALYCFLRETDDFEAMMRLAIVHKGDTDSTACIAGGFFGAYHGIEQLPAHLLAEVEGNDTIRELAEQLYHKVHQEN